MRIAAQLLRAFQQPRMAGQQIHQPLNRAGRLMFVQPQLEVHAHHGEIVAAGGQRQIERAGAGLGGFSNKQKIASGLRKMSAGPTKSAHGALHAQHGHFGADGGRSAFGIGKLLAGADGAKRNVVRHDQSDGRFDLSTVAPSIAP